MFLAIDAVSVDPVTGELLGDEPGEDPSQGVIICNVQRFNPTPEQLRDAVANVRVPAPQGDDTLGGPEDLVPIPGPVGPDGSIENCVPMNIFGHGNVSDEARRYVVSPKWGRSAVVQSFAEILFQGDVWQGFGPGPFSMAAGATYREESFWQRGYPVELMKYGPPINAPDLGIRGIPPGFTGGSANLHEFSTVPAISGEFDVWEVFSEFIMPLYASGDRRLELNLAGRRSDYSLGGEITSYKAGIDFTVNEALRLRTTLSRDVREATFSERLDRKSTRLNSSHVKSSYAVFCLKKKKGRRSPGDPRHRTGSAKTWPPEVRPRRRAARALQLFRSRAANVPASGATPRPMSDGRCS